MLKHWFFFFFTYSSQELDLILPFSTLSHGCEGASSDSGSHRWLPPETRCWASQADISFKLIHSHIGQPGVPPPPPLPYPLTHLRFIPPPPLPSSLHPSSTSSADQKTDRAREAEEQPPVVMLQLGKQLDFLNVWFGLWWLNDTSRSRLEANGKLLKLVCRNRA